MSKELKSTRQLNIEVLRIFAMFLITLWHIGCHFLRALNLDNSTNVIIMNYILTFISFHVDLFILITGYFGVKDCKKTLLKTLLLVYFYSVFLGLSSWIFTDKIDISATLFPVSNLTWWFMTMYIVMIMIAPIIETFIKVCKRATLYLLLGGVLFVNVYLGYLHHVHSIYDKGYGIINFVCIYIIGAYIRTEGQQLINRLKYPLTYILLAIVLLLLLQYKAIPYFSWDQLNEYCAPYPICMSILVFLLFLQIKIAESLRKVIMFFSSSSIAVYLITEYAEIRSLLIKQFSIWYLPNQYSFNGMLVIFGSVFLMFILSCIVDKIRIPITNYCNKIIIEKIQRL